MSIAKLNISEQLGDIKVEDEDSGPAMFNKRLVKVLSRDRLQDGEC